MLHSSTELQDMADKMVAWGGTPDASPPLHEVVLLENQRWGLRKKWSSDNLFATERDALTHEDGTGSYAWTIEHNVRVPHIACPTGWKWVSEWACEDWQYAFVFGLALRSTASRRSYVRCRRYKRSMV